MSALRVGLLCYGLDRPLSGTTRVAQQLGVALTHQPGVEVVYLTPYRNGPFRGAGYKSAYLPGCRLLPFLMAMGGPLIALAARRHKLDLVHDPVGVGPFPPRGRLAPFRRLLTVHDAIAFRYPEGYPWLNTFLHRRYVPAVLPWIDAVCVDSEHAREEVQRFLRWPRERTHVVPLAVAPHFRPLPSAEARAVASSFGLHGPYVLSVGSQQARKNLVGLIRAFHVLRREHPELSLAIVGPTQWTYHDHHDLLDELGLREAVHHLGYVEDETLPALYTAAELFVFPSLYEGFGLPILEAMACGVPVVCSNTTSLPEVAGDAALLIDPTHHEDVSDAMRRALSDPELRESLRGRGLERARHFDWSRAARQTVTVYERILGT